MKGSLLIKTDCGSVIRVIIDKKYGMTLSRMDDKLGWKFPISKLNSKKGLQEALGTALKYAEKEGIIWADTPWDGRYAIDDHLQ